jgi:hypothetical protein
MNLLRGTRQTLIGCTGNQAPNRKTGSPSTHGCE